MYENASIGIKRIFTAEVLCLIATILVTISSIVPLAGIAGLVAVVPILALSAVLAIIGYIMRLVGIHRASKDGFDFGKAFLFAIISLILSIIKAFCSATAAGRTLGVVITILDIIVTVFVIMSVCTILREMNENALADKGKNTMIIYIVGYLISQIITAVMGGMSFSFGRLVAAGILAVVALILTLIAYISYMSFLAKSKNII